MTARRNPPMGYACNCVGWPRRFVSDLKNMVDNARTITHRTFMDRVDMTDVAYLEGGLGYGRDGLRMAEDGYVTYHSGTLFGVRVYYFKHSCIEYVFAPAKVKSRLTNAL